EIVVFMLFLKIFKAFQKPTKLLWLYWLNPLVILEITGNLHFEGLVLLFLLASILAFEKKNEPLSGGFWGFAVGMKLLPFMLLPAWFFFNKTKKNTLFWAGAILALMLSLGWFFVSASDANFLQSLKLYQGKFEFNASIYYLLREVGFWIQGYNTIGALTKILSIVTLIAIVFFSWKKKPQTLIELVDLWILIYLIYLILQPVVHPWYLIPAFGLSLLTGRNTFLIWTFAAIFSYQAYESDPVTENPVFLLIEYLLVLGGIYLDYLLPKRTLNFKP
ncbi:MAG TPA: glycosyltransferase 87 family protein, partial [Algoriphagus sp.]|nr:glycosyltransferase 87 family protein [Algoriphagus sp.]